MTSVSSDINARKLELLQAFLKQVPGRVTAILENWQRLVEEDWSAEQLKTLMERLQTLAEASGKFGMPQIQAGGQSLLSQLSNFHKTSSRPCQDDVRAFDGLMQAFQDLALEACQQPQGLVQHPPHTQAHHPPTNPCSKIILLGLAENITGGLKKVLEHAGFQVESVADCDSVFGYPQSDCVTCHAVIAHVSWLKELYPPAKEAGLWQTESGLPGMPVAFIADNDDLPTRLAAMRTEAKAYWTCPLDYTLVANRMRELTSASNQAPYRILVVDDDPAQADFANLILSKANFTCRSVTTPLQVMEILRAFRPDLILMDLYMPEASGSELTTVIREQPEFVDIPIVFLSGEQDRDKQLNALSCGGEDFLSKPIGPKHLIKTVTNRIRRARQLAHGWRASHPSEDAVRLNTANQLLAKLETLLQTDSSSAPQYAILYLDLDDADQVLDRVGIGGLDVVLNGITSQLGQLLKTQEVISRVGDHSLSLVISCTSEESLEDLGNQLCSALAKLVMKVDNHTLGVSFSIGACLLDHTTQDVRALFSRAQSACKLAHKAGGNRLHLAASTNTPGPGSDNDSNSLAKLITSALEANSFEIHFQPIVSLKGGSNEANYQALIRLQEADGRLLTAAEFIPQAEQMGIIHKIDQWITRTALSIINQHKQQGQKLHLFLSQATDLLENMQRLSWLREKHRRGLIGKDDITFEFRLGDIAQKLDSAKVCFEMLHTMGISTLLTGVDNTADAQRTLNLLPLDYVKLDAKLLQNPDPALKQLIAKIHAQKLQIIAPRVEDPRSIALLWSSGVDYVQGNFVQRPENNLLYEFNESILN
jgi:diguanylate cyclase (GGDEF)-like protein